MKEINMADVAVSADNMINLKNSKILVNVEEALADLLVVTYCTEDKKFQGVLLDSNKSNLPFGVYGLNPGLSREPAKLKDVDEKLHSVNQRFIYQDPNYDGENDKPRKTGPKGKPQQRQKMTVRLRARKVLCSNCQGICNENNENVDVSKKRKHDSDDEITADNIESSKMDTKYIMNSTLIPKLSRLQPNEITSAIKGASKNSHKSNSKSVSKNTRGVKVVGNHSETPELTFVSVSNNLSDICDKQLAKNSSDLFGSTFPSARTLKICFGEGEGTVVKIPPITSDFNEDSGVSCDIIKPDVKAAKKALKKAKKQAKKITTTLTADSWNEHPHKHIGALSPRNNVSPPPIDPLEKKHKHKVKHKKKNKQQKTRDENMSKPIEADSINYFSDIKDHCLNQKLSISLRRLSSNSCEKRTEDGTETGSEEWESDSQPEFPASVPDSLEKKYVRVSPGDIVWGKVVGFPWWPGRVLSVTAAARAHIAWFASTTSSLMSCDSLSPFLEDYKIRFNKKKRGPYKEAVKQAMIEANRSESHPEDPLASPTQNLPTMSPRAIDVFS